MSCLTVFWNRLSIFPSAWFWQVLKTLRVGGGPCQGPGRSQMWKIHEKSPEKQPPTAQFSGEPGGGVHLLLTSNTTIEAGVVHRPRLLTGNQAFRCPNLTASGLAQWRLELEGVFNVFQCFSINGIAEYERHNCAALMLCHHLSMSYYTFPRRILRSLRFEAPESSSTGPRFAGGHRFQSNPGVHNGNGH